jgi:lipopolysaccharide transport system ATP-binding protein
MSEAIQVQNVYKQYDTIGTMRIRTIAQDAIRALRATTAARKAATNNSLRYVLHDVSFSLERGKSLGIIGHNGSGKTTLLRLLAGISLPTRGRIRVNGKVTPLLALGAGFHQDLTGHENLFLNCTLMGLDRKQSLDRIERIIEFADIGDYIEVPIKRYSSGMLARLGFAAAIHMDPEIILLDEVLSVGDYNFAAKATKAIKDYAGKGTLVFVSHDLNSVEKLCERVLWIEHGHLRAEGKAFNVIDKYIEDQQLALGKVVTNTEQEAIEVEISMPTLQPMLEDNDEVISEKVALDSRVQIRSINIYNKEGESQKEFAFEEDIVIRCNLFLSEAIHNLRAVIGIVDIETGAVVTACDNQQIDPIGHKSGEVILEVVFPAMRFRPRAFGTSINISDVLSLKPLCGWYDRSPRFRTLGKNQDPAHNFYAPQNDILYTPNVQMRVLNEK